MNRVQWGGIWFFFLGLWIIFLGMLVAGIPTIGGPNRAELVARTGLVTTIILILGLAHWIAAFLLYKQNKKSVAAGITLGIIDIVLMLILALRLVDIYNLSVFALDSWIAILFLVFTLITIWELFSIQKQKSQNKVAEPSKWPVFKVLCGIFVALVILFILWSSIFSVSRSFEPIVSAPTVSDLG